VTSIGDDPDLQSLADDEIKAVIDGTFVGG
jgi:hypothetical protein